MLKISFAIIALLQIGSNFVSPQKCGFRIRTSPKNDNHKYPNTGAWAKYNAQFKDSRKKRSISETSRTNDLLHTMVTMVKVADIMDSALEDLDQYTILAPNLASLEKLSRAEFLSLLSDQDSLKAIMLKHVVPSKITQEDLDNVDEAEIKTIGGETVTLRKKDGSISVSSNLGNATVVTTDMLGNNGIIHVIDNVI